MKRIGLIFAVAAMVALAACELIDDGTKGKGGAPGDGGYISLRFDETGLLMTTKADGGAKADTNAFLLKVTDQSGKEIYNGRYGDSPENILVGAGTYNIRVVSEEFSKPAFDSPQWGDEQYVKIENGENAIVNLVCGQLNSGVRLKISSSFLTDYPDAVLLLNNGDGTLAYSYREKRTAYFNPGTVSLILSRGGTDETLFERTLAGREILQLSINTASHQVERNHVSITLDTTRNYISEDFTIGQNYTEAQKGQDISNAYTITQAKAAVGEQNVWVAAYIVGGDLTSKSVSFEAPFTSASNLAIGARSTASSRDKCMAVQLPSGPIRDNLNLVSHPDLLGHFVYLHGDIVSSYFGLVGLKNVDDYSLK